MPEADPAQARSPAVSAALPKPRLATVSLAGCFGCHMSLLDIDERLFTLFDLVTFDRSPLTDVKHCGPCDIGLIEGGLCNAENVLVLREFPRPTARCWSPSVPVPSTAGCPPSAMPWTSARFLRDVYHTRDGLAADSAVPNDPELPLPLARVHPIHEVVHIDYFLPGCPPSADAIWDFLSALLAGRDPQPAPNHIRFD
jgi:NAD-reducing hydrogenase small subunit